MAFLYGLRHRNARRRADHVGRRMALAVFDGERVVADRQRIGQCQFVDGHVGVRRRLGVLAFDGEEVAFGVHALLEHQRDGRLAVQCMQLDRFVGADELDDGWRHETRGLFVQTQLERLVDAFVGRRVDAERLEHGDEDVVVDFDVGAELVDVRRGDAPHVRQSDEWTREALGALLALWCSLFRHHCSLFPHGWRGVCARARRSRVPLCFPRLLMVVAERHTSLVTNHRLQSSIAYVESVCKCGVLALSSQNWVI